jgi:hypothetical protein
MIFTYGLGWKKENKKEKEEKRKKAEIKKKKKWRKGELRPEVPPGAGSTTA